MLIRLFATALRISRPDGDSAPCQLSAVSCQWSFPNALRISRPDGGSEPCQLSAVICQPPPSGLPPASRERSVRRRAGRPCRRPVGVPFSSPGCHRTARPDSRPWRISRRRAPRALRSVSKRPGRHPWGCPSSVRRARPWGCESPRGWRRAPPVRRPVGHR